MDGNGYPRGKQFLLIQRSHPHGGASLVDPLLDLSPSCSVSFPPFLSQSPIVPFFLSSSISHSVSRPLLFLAARANLASANKCSSACHPRQFSLRTLLFPPFRPPRHGERGQLRSPPIDSIFVSCKSSRSRTSLQSDDQTSRDISNYV